MIKDLKELEALVKASVQNVVETKIHEDRLSVVAQELSRFDIDVYIVGPCIVEIVQPINVVSVFTSHADYRKFLPAGSSTRSRPSIIVRTGGPEFGSFRHIP